MSPSKVAPPSRLDLVRTALDELDRSIHQPNILSYGEKDYPEQLRFHQCTKRARFISGGNRGGKTDAEVVEAIWWATNTHPYLTRPEQWGNGPLQIRFVVVDVSKGIEQIILPKLKRWLTTSMLIEGSWDKSWNSKDFILTLANGSTIDFVTWGMDMMKLGGVPRHMIFFDEEPPQNIFNECMMRLLDYKGFWVIAATPTKGMGWTYDLLWEPAVEHPEGDVATFTLSAEQNPYLQASSSDMDFYMMGMDKEEREVREKGTWVARSGLVFPVFGQHFDRFVVDPFIPPKSWDWYSSADFGLNNPTAWLWHAVGPQGQIITFAEHYANEMVVNEHAAVVHSREKSWGKEPEMRVGDPAGKQRNGITGTSYLMEYAVNGIYINVEGIPHGVEIGIEKMQQYFRLRPDSPWLSAAERASGETRPTWVISNNCPNLIRELKKLRWATYASDKQAYDTNKQETVHKKDDHAFDSSRYFATLMPDLQPLTEAELTGGAIVPTTISYAEMMAKLREEESTSFATDEWQVSESYDDMFEGDYVG